MGKSDGVTAEVKDALGTTLEFIISEFPAYTIEDIMNLPISQFFLLVEMSADKKQRFGIMGLISGLGKSEAKSDGANKLALARMGIGTARR